MYKVTCVQDEVVATLLDLDRNLEPFRVELSRAHQMNVIVAMAQELMGKGVSILDAGLANESAYVAWGVEH